jgi:hypothetical protein
MHSLRQDQAIWTDSASFSSKGIRSKLNLDVQSVRDRGTESLQNKSNLLGAKGLIPPSRGGTAA